MSGVAEAAKLRPPPLRGAGLTRSFRQGKAEVRAVAGVDIEVMEGELVAVMGPSGSGKSTLLHMLGGMDRPDAGRVFIDGREISRLPEAQRVLVRRRDIGFVFQFFSLLPTLTALENVAFPLLLDGAVDARERAIDALRRVDMAERSEHRPSQLSGGEQQRVSIARTIATRPRIVLADEPTGNLDSRNGEAIFALLREIARDGASLLVVSHDPRASGYADRTIQLIDGCIQSDEPRLAPAYES